ncbi:MAG: transporter [Lentisphaerae bacterium]|nr:transporter [Lentisphaerota bacterium]
MPRRPACLLAAAALLLGGRPAPGVDIYDGVRAPRGLYFLSYSTFYAADVVTGPSGDAETRDFGYRSARQILRLSWYSPDYVVTALVPFGYTRADALDDSATGPGDILVAAGGFLPVRRADLLALLAAKIPSGDFDAADRVNAGSGQWDLRPSLFIHKAAGPYTMDGVVKYSFRQENPDTDFKPGDEWRVEVQATRRWGPFRIGPGASWVTGADAEQDGARLRDSGPRLLAVGAEAYSRVQGWSVTLQYLGDVYSENTTRGHLVTLKLCRRL